MEGGAKEEESPYRQSRKTTSNESSKSSSSHIPFPIICRGEKMRTRGCKGGVSGKTKRDSKSTPPLNVCCTVLCCAAFHPTACVINWNLVQYRAFCPYPFTMPASSPISLQCNQTRISQMDASPSRPQRGGQFIYGHKLHPHPSCTCL